MSLYRGEKEELEQKVEKLSELSKKYAGISWQDPEKVGKKAVDD